MTTKRVDMMLGLKYMLSYLGIQELEESTTEGKLYETKAALTQFILNQNLTTISVEQKEAMEGIEDLLRKVAARQIEEAPSKSSAQQTGIEEAASNNLALADRISKHLSAATVKTSALKKA